MLIEKKSLSITRLKLNGNGDDGMVNQVEKKSLSITRLKLAKLQIASELGVTWKEKPLDNEIETLGTSAPRCAVTFWKEKPLDNEIETP